MMPIAAMRLRKAAAGGPSPITKAASTTVVPASTFSTSSTSYVDLLNGSGGSIISVSVTKAAGTKIWLRAGMSIRMSGTNDSFMAVNDGTTDTMISSKYSTIANITRAQAGELLLSGLAAGTYTFKLRVKVAGSTLSFTSGVSSAYLTAIEVT